MSILKPWAPAGNIEFSFKKKSRKPKDLVTVCVTNFNYAAVICECLDSIVDQTHENIDLVVVDDLSERDESIAVIMEWMEENKQRFYRATLIQNKRNQGPSFSRNVAFENALGEAVFIMDADNTVYPKALEKTYAALINGSFPAVYTQIEEFGDRKGIGHADIWDPARMKQNNYVDVMALIRKDAWARVGGFCHIEEGWEDYDFWLKFIDCDLSPGYLPEILCRYRVHNTSRTATEALSAHYDLELVMEFRHPSPQKES